MGSDVYFLPFASDMIIKIDNVNNITSLIGPELKGCAKYNGGVLGEDGYI